MAELYTKNFHVIEKIKGDSRKLFVLDKWAPPGGGAQVIGAQLGLLCCVGSGWELYICVSRSPDLGTEEFFVGLKKDYLFYAQRDAYSKPTGIKDILDWQMLPAGDHFMVSEDNPVYIKVGALNINSNPIEYDAFVNLYYE